MAHLATMCHTASVHIQDPSMPSSPRRFVALLATLLFVPIACAEGERRPDQAPAPTSTVAETQPPPAATATTDKPKPPPNPDDALPPVVTSVSPSKATVGSVGPSIIVAGNNFVARSI